MQSYTKSVAIEIIQPSGILNRLHDSLFKTGLPLIKKVLTLLIKVALIPLRLIATTSVAGAWIYKKILGSGTYCSGTAPMISK